MCSGDLHHVCVLVKLSCCILYNLCFEYMWNVLYIVHAEWINFLRNSSVERAGRTSRSSRKRMIGWSISWHSVSRNYQQPVITFSYCSRVVPVQPKILRLVNITHHLTFKSLFFNVCYCYKVFLFLFLLFQYQYWWLKWSAVFRKGISSTRSLTVTRECKLGGYFPNPGLQVWRPPDSAWVLGRRLVVTVVYKC